MLENLFCAFTAVFFAVGFVCSVIFLLLFLSRTKKGTGVMISFIPAGDASAVARIGRILSGLRLLDAGARTRLIAVCEDGDTRTMSALRAAFFDDRRLTVCLRGELPELISDRQAPTRFV